MLLFTLIVRDVRVRRLLKWQLTQPVAHRPEPEAGNELTDVVIYPNPATEGRFTIVLPETAQTVSINIFDYQGRLLFEKTEKSISTLNIDSKLKGGIYLVKIRSKKFDIERKLMIR